MSRPWNSKVRLQLGPRTVLATVYAGWPRRKVIARAEQTFEPADCDSAQMPALDSGAVDSVLAQLGAAAAFPRAPVAIELADERVHFDLVSGDFASASERQLGTVATACVNELLGESAAEQAIRWHLQPDLAHLLICAIAQPDIDTLAQALARHGLQLASLQPEFSAAWNQHARRMPACTGVFGVSAGTHATVACTQRGAVIALSSGAWPDRPPMSDDPTALPRGLDQRVDRLLASAGIDAAGIASFVLVAAGLQARELAPRWTVVSPRQDSP